MSHRGLGYKKNSDQAKLSASLKLDMSKVGQTGEQGQRLAATEAQGYKPTLGPRLTSLNNSLSFASFSHPVNQSKDIGASKAYAEAMKALQRKIKSLEDERDEAKETIERLEKRLLSGKDAWEQRLKETERSASEMERKLHDTLSVLENSAQTQATVIERETTKATKSLKDSLQQLNSELTQVKAEYRDKSAQCVTTLEKCADLEVKNKGLGKVNGELQFRCAQLEEALAAKTTENRAAVSLGMYQEASEQLEHLQKTNEMLVQKLQYQQELTETQKEHIQYLTEQIRDLHKLYSADVAISRVTSTPHSPTFDPLPRGRSCRKSSQRASNSGSLNASFSSVSAKRLRKEIRRYQKERNALETSGRRDKDSRVELQALKKLISSKSKQLKQLGN